MSPRSVLNYNMKGQITIFRGWNCGAPAVGSQVVVLPAAGDGGGRAAADVMGVTVVLLVEL